LLRRLKSLVIGGERSPFDRSMYQKISLIAFFAWVGLGADGLSSSCYGPPESYKALGEYRYLGIFVALATAVTIFVIATSYSQIVELFPSGGGGYLVASKLLSPRLGLVAGCALMVDYVLTIALSIASGADALFSFVKPPVFQEPFFQFLHIDWATAKFGVAVLAVIILMIMNLRGVKESVGPLVPIFIAFVVTHAVLIGWAVFSHVGEVPQLAATTVAEVQSAHANEGLGGMFYLLVLAYSMGAGTYTGIEAISNGMPVLREPRIHTAKRTMTYMWISLAITVVGLVMGYLLFDAHELCDVNGKILKTINADLVEKVTVAWPFSLGAGFLFLTLLSEGAILFIAAQTGFLGGPRVLANLAMDRWFPVRFSMLSDRLVTQNGVLLMGLAALVTLIVTAGSVKALVIVYCINVFITFVLSQMGMVRHWWQSRGRVAAWRRKLSINGIGMVMSLLILALICWVKFLDGAWVTLVVTAALVTVALLVRRHYDQASRMVREVDRLARAVVDSSRELAIRSGRAHDKAPVYDPNGKTAVVLVSAFNGLGLHSLLNVIRFFGGAFRNFIFIGVGAVDAGNFKGIEEAESLRQHVEEETGRYVELMHQQGYFAEAFTSVGTDVVDEISEIAPRVIKKYPGAIFFAGQLVFPKDSLVIRLLHNNIAFSCQQRLYRQGIPFVILPFQVQSTDLTKKNHKKRNVQ
jgi:amino acid transporter